MHEGQIRRHDSQADPNGGQYRLVENLGNGEWVVEHLPADEVTVERIFDHWALAEESGRSTCPIWDKTWAECAEGERPQIIGRLTYEQELERELAGYAERAGTTSVYKFLSAERYAEHF